MNEASGLVVAGAEKSYAAATSGPVQALRGISFQMQKGEVVSIVGTNGSGKSTLLRVIAGLLPLDAGSVCVGGKDLKDISQKELARIRGILYQEPQKNLCLGFTIDEMVSLYGDGLDSLAEFRKLTNLLEKIVVDRARMVSTLSGGQQQLLALELVLARRPGLILLDEPTASLDVKNAALVRGRVRAAALAGISIIFVSHNIDEALNIANYLLLLHEGELLRSWRGEELARLTAGELREIMRESMMAGDGGDVLAGSVTKGGPGA